MQILNLLTSGYHRLDEAIESHLWLKLLQIAIIDAIVIGLFSYFLDHNSCIPLFMGLHLHNNYI